MVEDNVDHKSFRNTSFRLGSLRMMVMVVERERSLRIELGMVGGMEMEKGNGWWRVRTT